MKTTILLLLISTLSFGQSYNWDSIALETQKKLDRNVLIIKKFDMENKLDTTTEPQHDAKLPVSGSLRNDRIKEVAREIANSKTKGFTEEWEKYREEEYKYWLKRIRWAVRSNDR